MKIKIAILVDGDFYLKRYRSLFKNKEGFNPFDAEQAAKDFKNFIRRHYQSTEHETRYLYRIFYYDCEPFEKRVHHPLTNKSINFKNTDVAIFRRAFFEELKRQRKVALRLGVVKQHAAWVIRSEKTKALLKKEIEINDLREEDVYYDLTQKGVDMRIGLDIAALAYKRLVDRIVLISGDSDFVPTAKVARREGIDFMLDPMWQNIDPALNEHIDGLVSAFERPEKRNNKDKSKQ